MVSRPCHLMKNHGQGKNESLGCSLSTRPSIWGLRFVSSLLLCASGSPAVKWVHWSRSPRRCHLVLVIHEDDASFFLRGYCTDKSSHRAWHRRKRHMYDQKLLHLPWKEWEKDKNKPEIHSPPNIQIFLFSCFPFLCPPLSLYLYHLCPTFTFCWWWSSFIPLFLIPGFLPFVTSYLSFFPHSSNKDALLFSPWCGIESGD